MKVVIEATNLLRHSLWLLLMHCHWVQLHSLELWGLHSVGLIIIIIFKLLLIYVRLFLCKSIKFYILLSRKHWGALLGHLIKIWHSWGSLLIIELRGKLLHALLCCSVVSHLWV